MFACLRFISCSLFQYFCFIQFGANALTVAARNGSLETIKLLLSVGVNVNNKDIVCDFQQKKLSIYNYKIIEYGSRQESLQENDENLARI